MRKKLLALLMCATMVLGSSVVASADITSDNWSDAVTVFGRSTKLYDESDNASTLTTNVYVDGEGTVKYGFIAPNTPVRLSSNSKALTTLKAPNIDLAQKGNLSVDASKIYENLLLELQKAYGATATAYADKTIGFVTKGDLATANSGSVSTQYHVYVATVTNTSAADDSMFTFVEYPVAPGTSIATTTNATTGKTTLDSTVKYYTADGYCYIENADATLVKAITTASASDTTKYAYILTSVKAADVETKVSDDNIKAVAKAINLGTFDKTAAAVQIELIQYGTIDKTPYISRNVKVPSSAVTLTIQNDLLSRLKLNGFTSVYYISDSLASDTEAGSYKVVAPLASDIDYSAAYGTFTLPVNFVSSNGYLIFAQGNDASQNDGVSTETTAAPAADSVTAPKMGDVAPIAALAIVMMGAFGAMVVASKKRV